uniref:Cadherin domain-containing protein n=1 Tax=Panagrellus redivivus TaxID=6233 RepID=A0A7E4VWK5_PANRE
MPPPKLTGFKSVQCNQACVYFSRREVCVRTPKAIVASVLTVILKIIIGSRFRGAVVKAIGRIGFLVFHFLMRATPRMPTYVCQVSVKSIREVSSSVMCFFKGRKLIRSSGENSNYYKEMCFYCTFPESEVEPFFFDVRADAALNSVVVDTVVDPPNAVLQVVNVRSNNIPDIDFTEKFQIEQRNSGQFMVMTIGSLLLPEYPSTINETFLYMTVMCNDKPYPLITLRVRNYNTFTPKFYNYPYEVVLPGDATVNSVVNTPILALDRDPAFSYDVTFDIEWPHGFAATQTAVAARANRIERAEDMVQSNEAKDNDDHCRRRFYPRRCAMKQA